jgi:hypothetical protein
LSTHLPSDGSFLYMCGTLPTMQRERERESWSVSEGIQDEDKTVDSPNQLTVTMFSITITQLLELQIPTVLVRHDLGMEIETNLVEFRSSFRLHSTFLEDGTLIADPVAQFQVFLVLLWHFTCNSGRETGGVLVGHSARSYNG